MENDLWAFEFDTVQMVLEHYHDISVGVSQRSLTTYDNPESKRTGTNSDASFVITCMLAAEVARRVRRCGQDGMIVEERYGLNLMAAPKTIEQIADERVMLDVKIYRIINKVIWYCTGRNLIEQDYEGWKRGKKYRRRENILIIH
jgi:hypothetical protein